MKIALTDGVTLAGGILTPLVIAATGIGATASQHFSVQSRPDGGNRTFFFNTVPTGAFTALTADIEGSSDGGATFSAAPTLKAIDLLTGNTAFQLSPGFLYRFNIKTFTGGTAVSVNGTVN